MSHGPDLLRPTRRQFMQGAGVAGLALLVGCGRLPWQAQVSVRTSKVGVLSPGAPGTFSWEEAAFRQGLHELGYVEGQNLLLEWRYADNQPERRSVLAAELVNLPVDVIVTWNTPTIQSVQQATSTIPIVFANAGDPVGTGLVASLARPGGNTTGVSNISSDLSAKRLALLKETIPGLSRVAVLLTPNPSVVQQLAETERAAQILGLQLQILEVLQAEDLASAFDQASKQGAEAMNILGDPLLITNTARLAELALTSPLATTSGNGDFPRSGGLMSYGDDPRGRFHRVAAYVDKILKGAKPADLPVEQPREFEFVINMKTAQALGLTIPHHILLQATEVIE